MFYVTMKMVRNEEAYIVKGFFHSFKENLKQGIIINIIILAAFTMLSLDISLVRGMEGTVYKVLLYIFLVLLFMSMLIYLYIYPVIIILAAFTMLSLDISLVRGMEGTVYKVLLYIFLVLLFMSMLIYLYIYPVLAKFYNTIKHTFINAFLMSIRHLPYSILMIVISLLPFAILFIPSFRVQSFLIMLFMPSPVCYSLYSKLSGTVLPDHAFYLNGSSGNCLYCYSLYSKLSGTVLPDHAFYLNGSSGNCLY